MASKEQANNNKDFTGFFQRTVLQQAYHHYFYNVAQAKIQERQTNNKVRNNDELSGMKHD